MKPNTDPEQTLKNLRHMIAEAEEVLARTRGAMNPEEISDLKEKLQAGLDRLREYSGQVGGRVRESYEEVEERIRDYYEDVEGRVRARVETTDQTLRAHPYRMAAITFGAGLILGALLRTDRWD